MAPANAASGGNQHQGAGRGNDHGGRGQLGATLVGARLDRIARRGIHTLSQLLEDGYSIRAADMPGADDLMIRIYAAMARKEREVISERTRAALAAAKARGAVLGGDRGYKAASGALCGERGCCPS